MKKYALIMLCTMAVMLIAVRAVFPMQCRYASERLASFFQFGADYTEILETIGRSLTESNARSELKETFTELFGGDETLIPVSAENHNNEE